METPFSDPSNSQNFSREMREKGRYDDNGRHLRRRHGGSEVGDGRISAARVSARSRGEARFTFPYLFVTTGLTRRWERRCSTVVLHTRYEGSVYLPRLPGSTPDLRGDPPRDFRSRFVTSSELREIPSMLSRVSKRSSLARLRSLLRGPPGVARAPSPHPTFASAPSGRSPPRTTTAPPSSPSTFST